MSKTINTHEAKTNLSQMLAELESGTESEFVIARSGRPIALLIPNSAGRGVKIGIAKNKFVAPAVDPELDRQAEKLFGFESHEDID